MAEDQRPVPHSPELRLRDVLHLGLRMPVTRPCPAASAQRSLPLLAGHLQLSGLLWVDTAEQERPLQLTAQQCRHML